MDTDTEYYETDTLTLFRNYLDNYTQLFQKIEESFSNIENSLQEFVPNHEKFANDIKAYGNSISEMQNGLKYIQTISVNMRIEANKIQSAELTQITDEFDVLFQSNKDKLQKLNLNKDILEQKVNNILRLLQDLQPIIANQKLKIQQFMTRNQEINAILPNVEIPANTPILNVKIDSIPLYNHITELQDKIKRELDVNHNNHRMIEQIKPQEEDTKNKIEDISRITKDLSDNFEELHFVLTNISIKSIHIGEEAKGFSVISSEISKFIKKYTTMVNNFILTIEDAKIHFETSISIIDTIQQHSTQTIEYFKQFEGLGNQLESFQKNK